MDENDKPLFEIDENYPLLHPGVLQVTMAQRMASGEDASKRAKDTWKIIDNWLGLDGKEFGPEQYSKVTKAWNAYRLMTIQTPLFVEGMAYKPPPEVIRAFDRMSNPYPKTVSSVKTSAIKYAIMVVAIVIAAITVGIYWASTFNLI
jgi:hypothetical protein